MKKTSAALLQQKYNVLVGHVRILRKTRQWDSLPAEKRNGIVSTIRLVLAKLKSLLPAVEFKKVIVAASLVTGLSFTSKAQFAAPLTDPFGYTFIDSLVFPTVGDIDNDGDLDMFVGNKLGDIFYLPNTGSVTVPAFGPAQTNPFTLLNVGNGYMTYPSLADMDNDGDLDMFVGDFYGDTHYFMNTGTAAVPVFDAPLINPFSLTNVPYNSSPIAVDMDNDGDLDLFIGDYYGDTHYFQNTGTASAPAFAAEQLNPFGIITVNYNAAPAPADLDNDGDYDLLIGDYYGDLHYFQNNGTAGAPVFGPEQINPFNLTNVGYYIAPAFADMDNDADLDLFVGESYGVLYYFQNMGGIGITETSSSAGFSIFPNPSSQQVTINFNQLMREASIELSTLTGQPVMVVSAESTQQMQLNIQHLPSGIYMASVKTSSGNAVYRLVKQ
ncbi:MAG: T9SS type A sorting domain-containing protein [Flavobacteriales bacterium]